MSEDNNEKKIARRVLLMKLATRLHVLSMVFGPVVFLVLAAFAAS